MTTASTVGTTDLIIHETSGPLTTINRDSAVFPRAPLVVSPAVSTVSSTDRPTIFTMHLTDNRIDGVEPVQPAGICKSLATVTSQK